jgi:hypothetical protein
LISTPDSKNPHEVMSERLIKMYNDWGGVKLKEKGVKVYNYVF